jgi:hypothetical protein
MLDTPGLCRKDVPFWQGVPPPSKGPPLAENSLPLRLPA